MSLDEQIESDFEWLANVYNLNSAINHPSELHGILIGELAGNADISDEEWLSICLDHMGVEEFNSEKQPSIAHDLCDFRNKAQQAIAADSSALQLSLPDDSYSLSERGEALGAWVAGFLEGLAITQAKALTEIDDDLKEIVRDLVEISHLDVRLDDTETSERDFFEVCEYVRIGVLNLYAEFNEPASSDESEPAPTIH